MLAIAQFGTFEVDNYGDLLFPIIFEKELAARLSAFKLQLYSPLPTASNSKIKPIFPSSQNDCFSQDPDLKAIIIGGGDIISFSKEITSHYKQYWPYRMSPHMACWGIPSIRRSPHTPIIWNAPGVPHPFTNDQAILMRILAAQADYLSVRDEISLSYLRLAGVDQPVHIVPDTVLMLPKHLPSEQLKPLATRIFEPFDVDLGEPILFQIHPAINEKLIPDIIQTLHQLKTKLGRPILLLPIGNCHHDHMILAKLKQASKGAFQLIEEKLDIASMAAVIAHAGCFIGTSLHGNITAFAYQVPHIIYNGAQLTKLKGFAQLIEEPERCLTDLKDVVDRHVLLNKKPSSMILRKISAQIAAHFDRIVNIVSNNNSYYMKKSYDPLILEHYIQIVYDMQSQQEQLNQIQQSKAWQLTCLMKKTIDHFPFIKAILKYIFSLRDTLKISNTNTPNFKTVSKRLTMKPEKRTLDKINPSDIFSNY